MLGRTSTHTWPGRRLTRPVALAVTMLLIGLGAPGSVSTAPTATAPRIGCERPESAHSSARARPGAVHGSDPNSVTSAEAAAMDRALRASVSRLKRQGKLARSGTASRPTPIKVRTFVHVITKANGTGAITLAKIKAQMKVINDAYAGDASHVSAQMPFHFELTSVDVTKNNDWYAWSLYNDNDNDQAKQALHKGGWADLNIYIAALQDQLLGYATFPSDNVLKDDGLVILNASMPGGSAAPFNRGDTATHEIGHWVGLFHTFEGGCVAPGDYVSDTPYQADGDNIFFCRAYDDTCKQPGKDPVHNFMSYGDDPCMNRFTAGQVKRATQSWSAYRRGR